MHIQLAVFRTYTPNCVEHVLTGIESCKHVGIINWTNNTEVMPIAFGEQTVEILPEYHFELKLWIQFECNLPNWINQLLGEEGEKEMLNKLHFRMFFRTPFGHPNLHTGSMVPIQPQNSPVKRSLRTMAEECKAFKSEDRKLRTVKLSLPNCNDFKFYFSHRSDSPL